MKKVSFLLGLILLPTMALAEDKPATDEKKYDLVLNIRRIGLDLSQTKVSNADQYADSPIQALKASGQEYIKGVSDVVLEYKKDKFNWDNSLFMEYGRTKLKPYDSAATTNENADKILLSSDLSYECWESYGLKFGPMARAQYETEFTSNGSVPRQNQVRALAGLSLFDHPIIKTLYLAGVYEYDFTYSDDQISKTAAELGWRLEYKIREGVNISTNGYYREYFSYSDYVKTDLERDLSAVLRLDTNLWNNFTMGPYVQYRLAKSRAAEDYASNFIIGISFNYITKFGLM
ncbi:DUF3078 domain-containing protein [Lachnospiraceae bacterium OttesenSCG-928-E19]|nr:DUF3078 domain-containing protein [Lachnospiraceae bacterium OttesenSCG-928-E19]